MAVSAAGHLYTWGKGEGWKLGHATDEHVRYPEMVAAMRDKRVVSVALGVGHVMALTDRGEVYGWGKNDNEQICEDAVGSGDIYVQQPKLIEALRGQRIVGVCCGPIQTFTWTDVRSTSPRICMPFVVDLTEMTFRLVFVFGGWGLFN